MPDYLYIYQGIDTFLVENAVESLVKTLNVDPFNILTYDLEEQTIDHLLQEMTTVSFFSDKKIIKVKNPWFFYESSKEEGISDLIRYFKNPNEDTFVIFYLSKALDQSILISKEAKKYCRIELIKDMDKKDFEPYVKSVFKTFDYQIDDLATKELVERTNFDIVLLNNEVEKLKLYKMDQKQIALDDIIRLVSRNLEENIFELTNAILAKNKRRIMEVYGDLLEKNEDPIRIISQTSSKLKETIHTKKLLEKGYTQEKIAEFFNVKPGRAYYMVKNASSLKSRDLEKYFKRLTELDYQIKSGQIDKKIGLELFLLEV